jgi:hypothetical protein
VLLLAVVGWIKIIEGTNVVIGLEHFDSGEYAVGDYYFFAKSCPQF